MSTGEIRRGSRGTWNQSPTHLGRRALNGTSREWQHTVRVTVREDLRRHDREQRQEEDLERRRECEEHEVEVRLACCLLRDFVVLVHSFPVVLHPPSDTVSRANTYSTFVRTVNLHCSSLKKPPLYLFLSLRF